MIKSTSVTKSRYFWGSASVSCLISFLESLRLAATGPEVEASAPLATLADGDVGTTASPDGPTMLRVFAFLSSSVGKRSASLSRPSVSTLGGSDSAIAISAGPRALIFSTIWRTWQACWQVLATACVGQVAVGADPVWQAAATLATQEEGTMSSLSGTDGYQSLSGAPKDGR